MSEREEFEAWVAHEWPGLVIDRSELMGFYKGDDGARIDDMWEAWQAARRTVSGQEAVAFADWELIRVKNLAELVDALDRADRKGYMPDAIADSWEAFQYITR